MIGISALNNAIIVQFDEPSLTTSPVDPERLTEFNDKVRLNKYLISKGQSGFWLTAREAQCLDYKSQGLTAKEIAKIWGISPRTVETFFTNLKLKSGLSNIKQLIQLCKDDGLL